jgi:CheY-like chemotaxis protein
MTDDLFSVRVIIVAGLPTDRDLFRQAASAAKVPIELVEADGAASAGRAIAAGADLVFIEAGLGGEAAAQTVAAARAAAKPPFTVLLGQPDAPAAPFVTDALVTRPSGFHEATSLIETASRVRRQSRVLVLDDSATMRSIVCKLLTTAGFPLEIAQAAQGIEAIELARKIDFDLVFLDYNLPGFSGLETMAELRREKRNPHCVLITSAQDSAIESRARAQGAAFLKKPFYPADIEAILCKFYGLRALNPQRAKLS